MVSNAPLVGLAKKPLEKPVREVGSFMALALDTLVQALRPPFFWREVIEQCWFIARVATSRRSRNRLPSTGWSYSSSALRRSRSVRVT